MPHASLQGVRAIFFDVDNTLYDFEDSMRIAFVDLHKEFPDSLGQHDVKLIEDAYWKTYRGKSEDEKVLLINTNPDLFRRVMWAGALERLGLDGDPEGFARVITNKFQAKRPAQWRQAMYAGARELLFELKPRYVLGAITNGPSPVQRPKLEALSYRDYFEESRVFVSGEFGVRKPDASIFLAAAKAAGVKPHECLMVGDAREFDMPSKAVGFRTILFDGKKEAPDTTKDPYPPDFVATSYHEIRALL